jgi:hypothetical protein
LYLPEGGIHGAEYPAETESGLPAFLFRSLSGTLADFFIPEETRCQGFGNGFF